MLLNHHKLNCCPAISKPSHWHCTLLSSSFFYVYGQECRGERHMHKANTVFHSERNLQEQWHKSESRNMLMFFNVLLKKCLEKWIDLLICASIHPSVAEAV
ncbi:hypothetical protein AMECASPLE_005557 [Ameca splendens]|uniref:Uncharacterized protein n=1 Tax=Ameca splendens TaxID=208324 RepID=A0ABV0YMH4_9TELE